MATGSAIFEINQTAAHNHVCCIEALLKYYFVNVAAYKIHHLTNFNCLIIKVNIRYSLVTDAQTEGGTAESY